MDVLFGINFLMDYIVLMLMNKVMKFAATNKKLLLSATFGALWSIAAVMIPQVYKLFVNICTYILIGPIMVRICAGNNIKCVLKGTICLMTISMLFGGILHFLYYNTYAGYLINVIFMGDELLLVFTGVSAFLVVLVIGWIFSYRKDKESARRIRCIVGTEEVQLQAIIDTGNNLSDPVTGKPVTVIEKKSMGNILNKIDDYTKVKYHLIPFRTVGCESGMMEVITVDVMYIYDEENTVRLEKVLVGLSENKLSGQNRFEALINPQLLEKRV